MENIITKEKLAKYFDVTSRALEKVRAAMPTAKGERLKADILLDMAERYFSDAKHFEAKGDAVNAFACLNYAHGWLDSGARLGLFDVHDNNLFTAD